jgi:MoaA/NifB/PqqE/SkfB family radical SAM enzyme
MNIIKEMNLIKKVFLSNFDYLKFPYKLTFATTYKCNSKCMTCNIWKKQPKNEMSLNEIETFSQNNPFFSWFNLTGGEPFLRKDLVSIVDSFLNNSNNFLFLNLTTNGLSSDLIVKKVNEILSLHIPMVVVVVSLDGSKKIHESIRRTPDSWDRTIETYKSLRKMSQEKNNFRTFLGYTISPFNLGTIKEAYSSVKEIIPGIKPKDFHFNLFHLSEHYYSNISNSGNFTQKTYKRGLINDLEDIEKMKKDLLPGPIQFLEKKYIKLAKEFVKNDKTPLSCKVIQTSCFIDPEGNVFPCTVYAKLLGNLRNFDYDLTKILKLHFINQLIKEIENLKCPNCWTPCEAYQTILGNLFRVINSG